jgi:hypothetical protein
LAAESRTLHRPAAPFPSLQDAQQQEGTGKVDKKKLEAIGARLQAEAEEFEENALEALESGKRSARIQFTFASRDQAIVAVCDPKGPYLQTMPTKKAHGYVEIVNDAHKHLDAILDAYLDDDRRRAIEYVRKLFKTIKTAQKLGRPEAPHKPAVMGKTLAWLSAQDTAPIQARVREFIENAVWDLGKCLSDGATKNWAREALELDRQRRQEGQ